jgi:hypothetical protein
MVGIFADRLVAPAVAGKSVRDIAAAVIAAGYQAACRRESVKVDIDGYMEILRLGNCRTKVVKGP